MERIDGALPYYRFSLWPSLTHGVFSRHGGVSTGAFTSLNMGGTVGDDVEAVRENHNLMYDALGVNRDKTVTVWQVHGIDTVIADRPVEGRRWLAQADAMMTDKPGVTLVMRYADCTPIFAHDPQRGVIGVAHAGWRGTVMGMAYNLIRAMVESYGCRPSDLQAGIGPSIGPDRYQVGEEVVAQAGDYYGEDALPALFKRDPSDGTAYFNLWEANKRDLMRAGLDAEQIEIAELCTATRTDEFYSHRAEKGHTGRFGALIAL